MPTVLIVVSPLSSVVASVYGISRPSETSRTRNGIAEMVGDAVSERAKLTKPARVEGAMRSMGMSKLSSKSLNVD